MNKQQSRELSAAYTTVAESVQARDNGRPYPAWKENQARLVIGRLSSAGY